MPEIRVGAFPAPRTEHAEPSRARAMDHIYIRYRHEPSPEPHHPRTTTTNTNAGVANGTGTNGTRIPAVASHRRWNVSIRANKSPTSRCTLIDPLLPEQYASVFETYLRDSDRPRWSAHNLTSLVDGDADGDEGWMRGNTQMRNQIHDYAAALLAQLNLDVDSFTPGATYCQVYIVDHADPETENDDGGIHCLAWELLEMARLQDLPKLRFLVTRVTDFIAFPDVHPFVVKQPLAQVQADTTLTFRILLVVARDFSRIGAERDPEPDLAQWPLMNMQKRLRARLLLEVVRPGSVEELRAHLRVRDRQGIRFHLVHFDLHGRIGSDSKGRPSPYLLFARHHHTQGAPQTNLARADTVAELLADYKVENVVLNACLSAYNSTTSATNLAHIFLKHGVRRVSAMWFYVHWQTVSTYLETFYHALLVKGVDFDHAAARGRAAIRNKPGQTFQDFFLCVNYASETPLTARRSPSPSASLRSQDSGRSAGSARSIKSGLWKPPTPRLGENLPTFGDEPVMRMKLHFLELEYKLMTSRLVYASDLRRADSKLAWSIERLVAMWLATNLVDDVFYYKAKDFAKRRLSVGATVSARERRTRNGGLNAAAGGYLGLLFPRPVKSLRSGLHIIREVDAVVDPGMQADAEANHKAEERRMLAQENLQRFVARLHEDEGASGGGAGDGAQDGGERHHVLFLGSNDAQWWRTYLQYLGGEWWVSMSWGFTLHSRHRDVRFPGQRSGLGGCS